MNLLVNCAASWGSQSKIWIDESALRDPIICNLSYLEIVKVSPPQPDPTDKQLVSPTPICTFIAFLNLNPALPLSPCRTLCVFVCVCDREALS